MRRSLAALLAVLSAGAGGLLYASGVSVTWELPTQNVDGSAIPASGEGSIASTTLEYGPCTTAGAVPATPAELTVNGAGTTADLNGLIPGREYCVRAFVTNTFGQKSGYSNTVKKQVPFPVPRPPVLR